MKKKRVTINMVKENKKENHVNIEFQEKARQGNILGLPGHGRWLQFQNKCDCDQINCDQNKCGLY